MKKIVIIIFYALLFSACTNKYPKCGDEDVKKQVIAVCINTLEKNVAINASIDEFDKSDLSWEYNAV